MKTLHSPCQILFEMVSNNTHDAPSIDSATTNTAPSDHSTPVMSDQINDIEKGAQAADQQSTENEEPANPDAKAEPTSEKSDAVAAGPPAPGPPPDGGFLAWMVVVGAFCGLFVSFGWINCKSPHSLIST